MLPEFTLWDNQQFLKKKNRRNSNDALISCSHHNFFSEFDSGRYIYKFVFLQYEMLTWPEAEIYCREAEGAHLASVRNARESKFLEKNLRMLRNHFGFSKLWIGASDLYNESHFSWSDGTPVTYQRWIRGEPSGQQRGRKEDCAVITADYPHWAKWKDEYCLHHLPFICQIRGKFISILLLVFSVTPFKIDQHKNLNRSRYAKTLAKIQVRGIFRIRAI